MPSFLAKNPITSAAATVLFSACATVQLSQAPFSPPPSGTARIESDQAVAVLTFAHVESSVEAEAVNCISQSLKAIYPDIRIITADEFRRKVFAYHIPDDEKERAKYVSLLIEHPALKERIELLKIRYFILVHGETASKTHADVISGYPGGGFILVTWDRKSKLAASIVDVTRARAIGDFGSTSSEKAWLIFPVLLIGMPAPTTEALAWQIIGEAVANFLAGRDHQITAEDTQTAKE